MESSQLLRYRKPPKRGLVRSEVFKGLQRKVVRIFQRKKPHNYDADSSACASVSNSSGFLDIEDSNNNEQGYITEFPLSDILEEHSLPDVKDGDDLDEDYHDTGYYARCSSDAESSNFMDFAEDQRSDSRNIGNFAIDVSPAEISGPSVIRGDLGNGNQETQSSKDLSRGEVAFGWIFVINNFVLELVSIVTDQLSSVQNPQFALVSMLMSLLAVLICVCELVYNGRKERVQWRWRGWIPWFYYPSPSNLHFGNFADMVGLACAIPQLIATVINYYFLCRHSNNPIKISFWPVIFGFGLLCSKFFENPNKQTLSPG